MYKKKFNLIKLKIKEAWKENGCNLIKLRRNVIIQPCWVRSIVDSIQHWGLKRTEWRGGAFWRRINRTACLNSHFAGRIKLSKLLSKRLFCDLQISSCSIGFVALENKFIYSQLSRKRKRNPCNMRCWACKIALWNGVAG